MKNKVEVCRVHSSAVLVSVLINLNGHELQCVFITRNGELARVGIFDAKPRDVGPFWIFESYTRRIVPAEAIRDARKQAQAALDEFEPQMDRMTSFDFVVDVAS